MELAAFPKAITEDIGHLSLTLQILLVEKGFKVRYCACIADGHPGFAQIKIYSVQFTRSQYSMLKRDSHWGYYRPVELSWVWVTNKQLLWWNFLLPHFEFKYLELFTLLVNVSLLITLDSSLLWVVIVLQPSECLLMPSWPINCLAIIDQSWQSIKQSINCLPFTSICPKPHFVYFLSRNLLAPLFATCRPTLIYKQKCLIKPCTHWEIPICLCLCLWSLQCFTRIGVCTSRSVGVNGAHYPNSVFHHTGGSSRSADLIHSGQWWQRCI